MPTRLLTAFALFVVLATALAASPLAGPDVVVVRRTGTNANGTEVMEVVDSSDARGNQLYSLATTSSGMKTLLDWYGSLSPSTAGLSPEEAAAMTYYTGSHVPLYIELEEGNSGAYCDWKARYTVEMPDGTVRQVASPKVVVKRNDPVFTGNDVALQAQTLVHETGHGVMSRIYGTERLPYTDWLTKEHAGGMVTDAKLAMIEGWAEFVGAWYTGRMTVASDPAGSLADNRYAYTDIYSRGTLRSSSDMLKTEGWVATALLDLAQSGIYTMDELGRVMASKAPATFSELVTGLETTYPDRVTRLRTSLADTSRGRMYPELYAASSGGGTSSGTGSTTGGSSGGTVAFPPLFQSGSGGSDRLVFGLVGAVAGAVIGAVVGGPASMVAIGIGAAVGFALGQLVAGLMESESQARAPGGTLTAAPGAPTVAGGGDAGETSPVQGTGDGLDDLRRACNEAFIRHLRASRSGTEQERRETLASYRALRARFLGMVGRTAGAGER